jgi:hypothetical protein
MLLHDIWKVLGTSQVAEITTLVSMVASTLIAQKKIFFLIMI